MIKKPESSNFSIVSFLQRSTWILRQPQAETINTIGDLYPIVLLDYWSDDDKSWFSESPKVRIVILMIFKRSTCVFKTTSCFRNSMMLMSQVRSARARWVVSEIHVNHSKIEKIFKKMIKVTKATDSINGMYLQTVLNGFDRSQLFCWIPEYPFNIMYLIIMKIRECNQTSCCRTGTPRLPCTPSQHTYQSNRKTSSMAAM